MTYEEIIEKLKVYFEDVSDFAYTNAKYDKEADIPDFKDVHSEGGEGMGERWVRVKHFIEDDIYIRVVGHYTSYNGTDFYNEWDSCSQVVPIEKTVVFYE